MYPLIELGPLRLSSGGLALVLATYLWIWLFARVGRRRGGSSLAEHAAACALPAIVGATLGARLWFGLLSLDLYGAAPALFVALRLSDLAWPGALLGGALAGGLWGRRRGATLPALADAAALALPLPVAVGAAGLLLSGEAFGATTGLPWGVSLLGAVRHPTQIYYALAALLTGAALIAIERGARARGAPLAPGALAAALLVAHGLTLLLVEPFRADSLTLAGGLRAAQLFGLALMLVGLWWLRAAPVGPPAGPGAPVT